MTPVYLHIGAMKTGSTYLQQMLLANREAIAQCGFLLPGTRWIQQVRAAQDAVALAGKDPKIRAEAAGAWDRLAEQMRHHHGRGVLMSMEFLSFATAKQATRMIRSLAPAPVHVVLTVRDAGRVIPSQWQTGVRSGRTTSWPDYMAGVRTSDTGRLAMRRYGSGRSARRTFERAQDIARMLDCWAPLVGPDRLHVVTVPRPPSDTRQLWERFASAVGLSADVGQQAPKRSNPSLGYASTELLRLVNLQLANYRRSEYNPVIKHYLAREVLTQLAAEETPPRMDAETAKFAHRWNRRVVAAINASQAQVIGDLNDLPTAGAANLAAPTVVSDAELLRAAAVTEQALHRLVRRLARRLGASVANLVPSTSQNQAAPAASPTEAATRIAALAGQAIELRRSRAPRGGGL